MKTNVLVAVLFSGVLGVSCKTNKPTAAEKKVAAKNEAKAEAGLVDQGVVDFLVSAADARLMGTKEGTLAVSKGTSAEIRNYGKQMQTDQAKMMAALKRVAQSHKITLPQTISAAKQDGFDDLDAKNGKEFDEKFMKMMKIDHERDLKEFKNAEDLKDQEVKQFAMEYLPMIQVHLDKLNALKEK